MDVDIFTKVCPRLNIQGQPRIEERGYEAGNDVSDGSKTTSKKALRLPPRSLVAQPHTEEAELTGVMQPCDDSDSSVSSEMLAVSSDSSSISISDQPMGTPETGAEREVEATFRLVLLKAFS